MHTDGSTGPLKLGPESVFNVDSAEKPTFPRLISNPESRDLTLSAPPIGHPILGE